MKPAGRKNYGSIPHLPNSRMGPGDHHCSPGQARIATEKPRDKHDLIIVEEKLDGSNVGVYRQDGILYPLTRAGYLANTSPYRQHLEFYKWVFENQERFLVLLNDGERAVGEWLWQAHGTRYDLPHEPFVLFDIMTEATRMLSCDIHIRNEERESYFPRPRILHIGGPYSVDRLLEDIKESGHGALDPVEGGVWRVERTNTHTVDFLVKYVRPGKIDGIYLQGEPYYNSWTLSIPLTKGESQW